MSDNARTALLTWRNMVLSATPGTLLRNLYSNFDSRIESTDAMAKRPPKACARTQQDETTKRPPKSKRKQRRAIKIEEGVKQDSTSETEQDDNEDEELETAPLSFRFVPKKRLKQRRVTVQDNTNPSKQGNDCN
jgi:hypothetical protein